MDLGTDFISELPEVILAGPVRMDDSVGCTELPPATCQASSQASLRAAIPTPCRNTAAVLEAAAGSLAKRALEAAAHDDGGEDPPSPAASTAAMEASTPPGRGGGQVSPSGSSEQGRGNTSNTSISTDLVVSDIYDMWCGWLDNPEEGNQLEQMLQMLTKGGEPFRSFIQFIARHTEPHRNAGLDEGALNEAVEEQATWRSCTAMRVACHAFTSPNTSSSEDGRFQVLSSTFSQLLLGMHHRSRAASMHISIVLQHIMSAHDVDAVNALLQNHAPFVFIRNLDRAGCPEFLLGLLLGIDTPLPALSANQSLRPISAAAMQLVLQYLRQTSFPGLVATLLRAGVQSAHASATKTRTAKLGSPAPRSPAPRRQSSWPSPGGPGTPGGLSGGWSPSVFMSTPQRLQTPKNEASPLFTLPPPPSSPSPSTFMDLPTAMMDAPFNSSPPLHSKPFAQSPEPRRSRSPALSRSSHGCSPPLVGSGSGSGSRSGRLRCGSGHGIGDTPLSMRALSPTPRTPGSIRESGPSSGAASACTASPSEEPQPQEAVGMLVEFLTCLLDTAGRAWEQRFRSKAQQDQDTEMRAEIRQRILELLFVETSMIPNLFQLLRGGVAQFESAALLRALLTHALAPQRCLAGLAEPLLAQFLPQVELLGALLLRRDTMPSSSGSHSAAQPTQELRLNAYTVREPLGALRVTAVQILAGLAELAPERTLAALKPAVWGVLVKWFFEQRCNHIFQAACGKLFIAAIHFGNVRLQQLILIKLKLLSAICETVLTEGACGDRWHELRPQVPAFTPACGSDSEGFCSVNSTADARVEKTQVGICQQRHPGGLGGITPVVAALVKVQNCAAAEAAQMNAALSMKGVSSGTPEMAGAVNRQPLAPRTVPQAASAGANPVEDIKPSGYTPIFIARLLGESATWPQVVGAISSTVNDARVGERSA